MTDTNSNVQAEAAKANKTAETPAKVEASTTPVAEAKIEEKKV